MKITSGGFEVVYHGRVFAYGMSPIEITLSEENDPLKFVFCIEHVAERDDFITDIRLTRYNEVRIACVKIPKSQAKSSRRTQRTRNAKRNSATSEGSSAPGTTSACIL